MKIYLVAGEASGDARGVELMRALRSRVPDCEFIGAGGHEMKRLAGEHFLDWADEAVVGLWDVLKKYGYFKRQFDRMMAEILETRPDALILIDYPGFNLRLAKAIRSKNPSTKILYYISPQVWAWHRGRIRQMAKDLDLMLCIFPFEKPLYEKSGLKTVFVGHPMLDSLASKKTNESRDPFLVGLFPGSRTKEVRKLFPVMIEAAKELHRRDSRYQFEAAAASPALADAMRTIVRGSVEPIEVQVTLQNSHALMQRAAAGMVCSGTATLEAAYFGLPMVILYKVAWLTWVIGKSLVRVPFLGMPNLLANKEIAREFLQDAAQPMPIADAVQQLIENHEVRERSTNELAAIITGLGEGGAAERAADAIIAALTPVA